MTETKTSPRPNKERDFLLPTHSAAAEDSYILDGSRVGNFFIVEAEQ